VDKPKFIKGVKPRLKPNPINDRYKRNKGRAFVGAEYLSDEEEEDEEKEAGVAGLAFSKPGSLFTYDYSKDYSTENDLGSSFMARITQDDDSDDSSSSTTIGSCLMARETKVMESPPSLSSVLDDEAENQKELNVLKELYNVRCTLRGEALVKFDFLMDSLKEKDESIEELEYHLNEKERRFNLLRQELKTERLKKELAKFTTTKSKMGLDDLLSKQRSNNQKYGLGYVPKPYKKNNYKKEKPAQEKNKKGYSSGGPKWVFDSGCTNHMTGGRGVLDQFIEDINKKSSITFGDNSKGKVLGYGKVAISKDLCLETVMLVEHLGYNLLSIYHLADAGYNSYFTKYYVQVFRSDNLKLVLVGYVENNLYVVDLSKESPSPSTCLMAAKHDEGWLWHRRLGHVNMRNLKQLLKGEHIVGLTGIYFEKDRVCSACVAGKQLKKKHPIKSIVTTSRPLELLHLDLFGPSHYDTLGGSKYGLVIVDDYSRYSWVFLLKSKDETHREFITFAKKAQRTYESEIKAIRTDNGTEFKNYTMQEFVDDEGIKHEFSAPYTPQQNGVVERKNRTIIEMARTMLSEFNSPHNFWGEAISTAVHYSNRLFLRPLHNKTPYELLTGNKPNVMYIRVFGCKCLVKNNKGKLGKFETRTIEGIFVGYAENSHAYRYYNRSTGTIEVSCDVVFLEDNGSQVEQVVPCVAGNDDDPSSAIKHMGIGHIRPMEVHSDDQGDGIEVSSSPQVEPSSTQVEPSSATQDASSTQDEPHPEEQEESPQPTEQDHDDDQDTSSTHVQAQVVPHDQVLARDEFIDHEGTIRKIKAATRASDMKVDLVLGSISKGVVTRRHHALLMTYCQHHAFVSSFEPLKVHEALVDPDWVIAMQEELECFTRNEVWSLVERPKDHRINVIGTKWVFKNKQDEDGIVIRNKARKFEMSMMGELKFFLGFQVRQLAKGTFISQEKYVKDMLKKFNMTNASPMKTPMPVKGQLGSCDGEKDVDIKKIWAQHHNSTDPVTRPVDRPLNRPARCMAGHRSQTGQSGLLSGSWSGETRGNASKRGRTNPPRRSSSRVPPPAQQGTDGGSSVGGRTKSVATKHKDKHVAHEDDEEVPTINVGAANRLEWQEWRTVNPYRFEKPTYTRSDKAFWTNTQAALWEGFYDSHEHMKHGTIVSPKAINPDELALHEATKYRFVVQTLKNLGLYDLVCLKPDDTQDDPTFCPLLVRQFHCTVFFHDDEDRTLTWMTGKTKYSCSYSQFRAAMGCGDDSNPGYRIHSRSRLTRGDISFCYPANPTPGPPTISGMYYSYLVLAKLFRENLISKSGDHSEVRNYHLNLMYYCHPDRVRKIDGCDLIYCELQRAIMDRMTPNYAQYVQRLINYIVPAPRNAIGERIIMDPFRFPTQEATRPDVPSMMPTSERRSKERHDHDASSSYSRRPKHGAARFFSSMWQMCKNTNDVAHQSLALNQETRRRQNEFMATRNVHVPPPGPELAPVVAPQWEMPPITDEMIQNFDFSMYAHGGLPPRTARTPTPPPADGDGDEDEVDSAARDDDEGSYSTGHKFY
ncbi:hypothetical protein QYE76_014727, partial [Lolium multiflorum]